MAEQIRIAELTIDDKQLLDSITQTKERLDALRSSQKRLTKEGQTSSAEYVKQAADVKTLNAEYGRQIKVLQATSKSTNELNSALQAETKSIDGAVQNNKQLKQIRNQVNASTEAGRKKIDQINKKLNENTKFIKTNSSDLEKQKQNIGNYKSALEGVNPQIGAFSRGLQQGRAVLQQIAVAFSFYIGKIKEGVTQMLTARAGTEGLSKAQKASAVASNVLSGALKILKFALIATGIGAIVVVLGSLVGMLANTQAGTDKVSQVMEALGAAFNVIIDRVSQFGGALVKFFSGDFQGGFDDMKSSLAGIGDEMKREAAEAFNLEKAMQSLKDREIELIGVNAKRKQQIEELRLLSKDENTSLKERARLLQEAGNIEKAILADDLKIAKERARISQARTDQGESTREELAENARVQAQVNELQTASLKLQRSIEAEKQGLLKRGAAESKAAFEERKRQIAEEEAIDLDVKNKAIEAEADYQARLLQVKNEAALLAAETEEERAIIKAEQEFEAKELEVEQLMVDEEKKTALLAFYAQERNDTLLDIQKKANDNQRKAKEDADKAILTLDQANAKAREKGTQQLLSVLSGLFGDNMAARIGMLVAEGAIAIGQIKANSAASAAQITASTQVAVAKAYAASPLTLGQPFAGAAILSGAAAIGATKLSATLGVAGVIAAQAAKGAKFATGGILSGPSHDHGGIRTPYGELEGGEAVINKKSTALFRPILSRLNAAGGGKKFAAGGILGSETTAASDLFNSDALADKIAEAYSNVPAPRVAVDEIQQVSNNVSVIEEQSRF